MPRGVEALQQASGAASAAALRDALSSCDGTRTFGEVLSAEQLSAKRPSKEIVCTGRRTSKRT
jgi:hypothetical protein